jgi:hypothetical protein
MQPRKKTTPASPPVNYVREIPPAFLIFLFTAVFFIVLILVVLDANKDIKKSPPPTPFTVGGSAAFTAPNVFIDDISLYYLYETMSELTTR